VLKKEIFKSNSMWFFALFLKLRIGFINLVDKKTGKTAMLHI